MIIHRFIGLKLYRMVYVGLNTLYWPKRLLNGLRMTNNHQSINHGQRDDEAYGR